MSNKVEEQKIEVMPENWWYSELVTYCNALIAYFGSGSDLNEVLEKKGRKQLGLTQINIGPEAIRSVIFSEGDHLIKPPASLRYVPFFTIWSCLEACHLIHLRKVSTPKVKLALVNGRRLDKSPSPEKGKIENDNMQHFEKSSSLVRQNSLSKLANTWLSHEQADIVTLSSIYGHPPYAMVRSVLVSLFPSWSPKQIRKFIQRSLNENCDRDENDLSEDFSDKFDAVFDDKIRWRLEKEIREAELADPICGPRHDKRRRELGMKYENLLEQRLKEFGVPFETEEDLRVRGTAKTPDILLSFPVAIKVLTIEQSSRTKGTKLMNGQRVDVNFETRSHSKSGVKSVKATKAEEWKMISWIDSKAMFGDAHTHNTDIVSQAEGYIHRFGPGLILYWFGHAPNTELDNCHGDIVVTGWNIPLTMMLPTGEIINYGENIVNTTINK